MPSFQTEARDPHADRRPSSPLPFPHAGARQEGELLSRAIARAKQGDASALHFLYVRYADDVCGYVQSIVRDPHEAEDITQSLFAKLLNKIQRYEQRQVPFSAWILRVARNAALDHLRARRQIPFEEVRTTDEGHDEVQFERFNSLREALDTLPEEQREVLVLRHVVGLSPVEIADRMKKTESAIHGLHHRGRGGELAERLLPDRTPKRRMLVIVNPYATTVSDRLRNLVVYALQSRYSVEAIDTEKRDHATQITREAAREGYDVVVAFGGDGTVNEAANGLVGSDTPLTALPGGSTNVWARTLGIPNDVVDATEHLLRMADDFDPFRVDLGTMNERHFVFAAGAGLDASVVRRVDQHPYRKAKFGAWYYSSSAVAIFTSRYLVNPPRVRVIAGERVQDGVTAVVQNSDPFTYFRKRPIRIVEPAGLNMGSLSIAVLKRATVMELATLVPRLLSGRAGSVMRHRQVEPLLELSHARVEAIDDRPFPVQVDGDFIGEVTEVEFSVTPRGLLAVS